MCVVFLRALLAVLFACLFACLIACLFVYLSDAGLCDSLCVDLSDR